MSKKIKKETVYKTDFIIESFKDEEIETMEYKSAYREYNNDGNVLLDVTFDPNGDIIEKYVYEYNSNGFKIEEKLFYGEGELTEHKTFEYEDKLLSKEFIHYQEGGMDTVFYTYEDGQLIEKQLIDFEGDKGDCEKITRENGMPVIHEKFDEDGELFEKDQLFYDENGNHIKTVRYESDLDREITIEFVLDENGNRTEIKNINEEGILFAKATLEYDENGRAVKMIEQNQFHSNERTMQYDENGNEIFQEEYNRNGELNHRIERSFDENNNPVESKVKIDKHGRGINEDYIIRYEYEYWD